MANCRFLTSFTITTGTDDVIRVEHSVSGARDVTLDSGTYYWSLDNAADDFNKELIDKINADATFSGAGLTFASTVYAVDEIDATKADGRVKYAVDSGTFFFDFDHANSTLDPRILGFATAATNEPASPGAASFDSDFTHRYGYYPQTCPAALIVRESNRRSYVEYSTGGYVDGAKRATTDYDIDIRLDARPSALIRTQAATVSAKAVSVGTTVDDPNISLEAWAGDCQDTSKSWLFYEDITAYTASDFYGPYRFRAGSYLWTRPADGEPDYPIGELWNRDIDGVTARG